MHDGEVGVHPIKRESRTWRVHRHTGIEARRTGNWILPDFGSTAHMIQGATLNAAFVDLEHESSISTMTAQIAAYVCFVQSKAAKQHLRYAAILKNAVCPR